MGLMEAIEYLKIMNKEIDFDLQGFVYGNEAINTVLKVIGNIHDNPELLKEE